MKKSYSKEDINLIKFGFMGMKWFCCFFIIFPPLLLIGNTSQQTLLSIGFISLLLTIGWGGYFLIIHYEKKNYSMYYDLISIILPTYNRRNFINRAIDSILNQTFENWELVIIDDGSTDNTKEFLNPLINQNDNIEYYYQKNQGFASACNVGFKNAKGKYFALLDSDDKYTPDHLEKRIRYLKLHPDLDLIHGGFQLFGKEEDWYVPDADHPGERIHLSQCVIGGTFFGRKEVFQTLNGYDEKLNFAHDYNFIQRATKQFKIGKVDFPTYIYHRDHEQSICRDFEQNPKTSN